MKLFGIILFAASLASAQSFTAEIKTSWNGVKSYILRSAEKMPDTSFDFKPTPEVRSFAQILGHVADAYYLFCAPVRGEQRTGDVEKTKTAKADMIAALKEATSYCDAAYDSMADTKVNEAVKFFGRERSRGYVLSFNISHTFEHYGNLITYMRIRGLVPPSSEPAPSR